MQKNIFLIGFMGAGKSSFGKRLANKLGYVFLDSDWEIEKSTKKSIPEIFEENGEEGFRTLETEWLENFNEIKCVVALGGGTPCFNENMTRINQKGFSIYLNLPPKILVDRLQSSRSIRPLIEPIKSDSEKLLEFVKQKLAERQEYYLKANYQITSVNMTATKTEDLIREIEPNLIIQ